MTDSALAADTAPWTCPFCPLLCDGFGVGVAGGRLRLTGSDCPRAAAALGTFGDAPSLATPQLDDRPCTLDTAIAAAARIVHQARQPLFAGLGCDVAGARALYRLAHDSGAICDAAGGAALMHGLRALQDRGAFTTTLAEVRTRADLIVCIGCSPRARQPEFFRRCGVGEDLVAARRLVFVGAEPDAALSGMPRSSVDTLPLHGDLFDTLALLAAHLDGAAVPVPAGLAELAAQLCAARYAVLVWEPAALPDQGALAVETINRIVGTLNRTTRAAGLALGGGDGAATANQVFAWLSGLPLRSRAGPSGLEHDPLRYDGAALLAGGAVDALLWVNGFGADGPPQPLSVPCIVLGRSTPAPRSASVFIPVSTPGVGSSGHLFRTDGVVLMPLHAVVADGLPRMADVVQRLQHALAALRSGAAA